MKTVNNLLYFLLLILSGQSIYAQDYKPPRFSPDGSILEVDYNENHGLFVLSNSKYWGMSTGSLALFEDNSDIPNLDFPRFYQSGNNVISDNNGGWFVSGATAYQNAQFRINEVDEVDYQNYLGIVHIKSDMSLDTSFHMNYNPFYWVGSDNSAPGKMALKNDRLFLEVTHRRYYPHNESSVLVLNSLTGERVNDDFNVKGNLYKMNIHGGTLYLSGYIEKVNDSTFVTPKRAVAIDINTLQLKDWNPFFANEPYSAIENWQFENNKIYVGYAKGSTTMDSTGFASVDTLSGLNKSIIYGKLYNPYDPLRLTFAYKNNVVYYPSKATVSTGTMFGDSSFHFVKAIDMDGQAVSSWDTLRYSLNSSYKGNSSYNFSHISGVYLNKENLIISGNFDYFGDSLRHCLAAINLNTNNITNWNPSPRTEIPVPEFVSTNNKLIIRHLYSDYYGLYKHIDLKPRIIDNIRTNNLIVINPITEEILDTNFSFIQKQPQFFKTNKNYLYSVGSESGGAEQTLNIYDLSTKTRLNQLPVTFKDDNGNPASISKIIGVADSVIYVMGSFASVNNIPRRGLACISNSGLIMPFVVNITPDAIGGILQNAELSGNRIYISGYFTAVNGNLRNNLAAVDRFTGQLLDWNPNPDQIVKKMWPIGDNLLISDSQTQIGGRTNIPYSKKNFLIDGQSGNLLHYWGNNEDFEDVLSINKYIITSLNNGTICGGDIYGFSNNYGLTYFDTERKTYSQTCLIKNPIGYGVNTKLLPKNFTRAGQNVYFQTFYNSQYYPVSSRAGWLKMKIPPKFLQDEFDYFPKVANNLGTATMNLSGYSLQKGITIKLFKNGFDDIFVPDSLISKIEEFNFEAQINLEGVSIGLWDLEITLPSGRKIIKQNGFEVRSPTPPVLQIQSHMGSQVRPNLPTKITITVSNTGETDACNSPLYLIYSSNVEIIGKMGIWSAGKYIVSETPTNFYVEKIGDENFTGNGSILLLPRVGASETVTIEFTVKGNNNLGESGYTIYTYPSYPESFELFCKIFSNPNVYCRQLILDITYAELGFNISEAQQIECIDKFTESLRKTDNFKNADFIDFQGSIANIIWECTAGGAGEYQDIYNALGGMITGGYFRNPIHLTDFSFECPPPPETPNKPGIPFTPFKRGFSISKPSFVTSMDPNDKLGPNGEGDLKYISNKERMNYLIRYENYATASANALRVEVVDTLDATKYDFSTFQFGYFNIADTTFYAPPGKKHYLRDWNLNPDENFIIRMEAEFDETTGIFKALYETLDPETMELTLDGSANVGFLPPNNNPPEGEGGVFFTIDLKENLAHGTEVTNDAFITFDFNNVIPTPPWTNIIDNEFPVSEIAPIQAVSSDTLIHLNWVGSDVGSGNRLFDIYVSVNDEPSYSFLRNTTMTSVTFTGKQNYSYKFYSIAVDSVGNEEEIPLAYDAKTTVQMPADIFSISSGNWNNPSIWNCSCIPTENDNVTIKSGHKVIHNASMGAHKTSKLTVESGAVLDAKGVFESKP